MINIPRWQSILIIAVVLLGLGFAAPNLLPKDDAEALPDWLPNQQINLGLDLRGGSYLLLEVQMDAVIQEQLENLVDAIRLSLRADKIGYTDLGAQGDRVSFTLRESSDGDRVSALLRNYSEGFQIGRDGAAFSLTLTEEAIRQRQATVMDQSIEIVRRRIDETGTREPSIQRQGSDRIVVQLPGIDDPERIKDILGQTAKMTFRFVDSEIVPGRDAIPPGSEVLPGASQRDGLDSQLYVVRKRVMVSGDTLTDAQPTFQEGQPVVSFTFDSVGAKRFADATRENVGRIFAIILDDKVISAPVIREPILGGSGVISGRFTVQEAQDMALLLRAGALPAPLTILEERTVGPGLGADSIRAGEIAAVLGMILVIIFMGAAYGLFGVFANIALLANLVLILAALSGLQATLTLPGIAGIVLTIGMAVDANVLIFERIREEVRNGRGPVSAVESGFRSALTTIVDSNLTTLIAAVLLFNFGSGPIKGFAVTLAIGIVTSMFSAIMVTRLIIVAWLRRRRPQTLAI
ncbi:protein translocase subunit SecD [Limibacillus sp. MBR-115]|jgi:preprotein translocase subunit SecD|uniref:protein translocase subunit SecD n=1 Tax=Limibacillus sp. MBR-115 TaxID=3156465 RepID=UPI003394F8FB